MNYLTLDLANGNLVLSNNSVWKSLRKWLGGGTLYSDYYDASNCGDYWGANSHFINVNANSIQLVFSIEFDFVNASTTYSCLCSIRYDVNTLYGVAVTADATGLNIVTDSTTKHIDCDYSNANIKVDIVADILTKEVTTYIHKNDVPLAKIINTTNFNFTAFVIESGGRGYQAYKLPTTTKLKNVSVSDDNISYSDFSDTINYVNKLGLAEIWANIKNYIAAQLLDKSNTGHTHVKSEITDFPSLSTVATSGSYNDLSDKPSPYIPPTFTYDSSTETLTVSNTTATVFNYDSNTETLEVQING